jgi:hypothetical protein
MYTIKTELFLANGIYAWEACSSVSVVSGCRLDNLSLRFEPRQGQRIFPPASVSRPALWPIQPPAQRILRGPFPGAKARPGRHADHSPPSSAEVESE